MNDLLEILLSKKVVVPERYEQYKDIFRHFRGKQVTVGDLNIKGKSPTNIFDDPTKFYRSSGNDGFLMGDVLENLPPIWLGKKADDGSVTTKKTADTMFMVLSTECDCEIRGDGSHLSYVRVCPVYSEAEVLGLMKGQGDVGQLQGNLQSNSVIEYFWMPKVLKKGSGLVADLTHVFSVNIEMLHEKVSAGDIKRIVSLSETAFFLLQIKLAWFFSRPETSDSKRPKLEAFELK